MNKESAKLKRLDIGWYYIKYQLFTKALWFFLIFPFYRWMLQRLIDSTGHVSISSGDYLDFLLTPQGIIALIITILTWMFLIGLDIHSFIWLSALYQEKRSLPTMSGLIVLSITSLKRLLNPIGLLITLYIALIIPIVGVGFSISMTESFKIPNFIADVIYLNPLYTTAYVVILLILTIITLGSIFFFHFVLLKNQPLIKSLKESFCMVRVHFKSFIRDFLLKTVMAYVGIIFGCMLIFFGIFFRLEAMTDVALRRATILFFMLTMTEIITFFSLIGVPLMTHQLTRLFYRFHREEGQNIPFSLSIPDKYIKTGETSWKRRWRSIGIGFTAASLILINCLAGYIGSLYFDEIFKTNRNIEIIAHRAGGDLAAENSLEGLKKAIEEGASRSEIDVQRTKDGYYIIHHDATFKRLTGVKCSSDQMTLSEIQGLKIHDLFQKDRADQPVETLDAFIQQAKGNIGLLIELKGHTADTKMADDVISTIRKYKMEKEAVILSLDYKMIQYIEKTNPDIQTGFLYFFSFGNDKMLTGDYLIMEEAQATDENIEYVHEAGKKVIVWTVNTEDSMSTYLDSDVDGIITDHLRLAKEQQKVKEKRTDFERILDYIRF